MKYRNKKTSKQIERHFKGIANHWRLDILLLIEKKQDLSLDQIVSELQGNLKTISEHTRRLVFAGLINKKNQGRSVIHSLSPYGKSFARFVRTFQHS